MEKRVSVKTLYLLLVIAGGLIVLGVGSTYAIFTASVEINNPITLTSNLTYESDIMETIEVAVPSGKIVSTTLNINNSSGSTVNYVAWYLDEGNNIILGADSGNPTGSLANGESTSIVVELKNTGNSNSVITLGISSSSSNVVLGKNMYTIPSGFYGSTEFSYDNSNTGVNCFDVTCMLDELYNLVD